MLLQVVCQRFAYRLVHGSAHFVVAELRLGLPLELRFCHLYRDYGNQPFAEVFARNLHLCFFQSLALFGIFLQYAGQRRAETGLMRAAFDGVDVVYV